MSSEPRARYQSRELDRFQRDFEDLFDRFLGGRGAGEPRTKGGPVLESFIEAGKLIVRADLPGIDPKEVEVTVDGDHLTIRGKRESSREETGRDYTHREIYYGSFERTIQLPEGVKTDDIKASYHDGVLELTIPIPEHAKAHKVPIEIVSKS